MKNLRFANVGPVPAPWEGSVAEVSAYKYRVFLTCSPGDQAWGRWLRATLESFRIDKDIIGRPTPVGRVPKSLRPIFWDCADPATGAAISVFAGILPTIQAFGAAAKHRGGRRPADRVGTAASGAHSLSKTGVNALFVAHPTDASTLTTPEDKRRHAERAYAQRLVDQARIRQIDERTSAALQASQFLVVLCSPESAACPRIDEQIRRFYAMNRGSRVIPIIVGGEPGHPVRDCFPKSLRYKLSAEREATDECGEPIADARPDDDGTNLTKNRERALQRVAAQLIGLPFEQAEPRFERARTRRSHMRHAAIAAVFAALLAYEGGIAFARQELVGNEVLLDRTVQMVAVLADTAASAARTLGLPRSVSADILENGEDAARDLLTLGADSPRLRYRRAALLIEFARHYAALGQAEGSAELLRARARATEAEVLMRSLAAEVPGNPGWQRDMSDTYDGLGDVLQAQGRLKEALAAYRASAAIAERVATEQLRKELAGKAERESVLTGRQRDLAARYIKAGDVAIALTEKGALDDALESYQASLAIDQRLAAADRNDARWQYGLLVAHEKIGDVFRVQGELEQALASYRSGQAIAEALLAAEPGNLAWRKAFSVSQIKVGDVLAFAGKSEEALASYRLSNSIAERVTTERATDPGIAAWQHHLAISHDRIGSVLHAQGDLVAALREYRISVTIAGRASSADPANSAWQRDLGIAHEHLGEVLQALGDLPGALKEFEGKRAIVARLAEAEPGNSGWQYDLGNSHARIGVVLEARGSFDAALKEYEACLAIGRRFVAADPGNAQWQRDLAVSYQRLAEARLRLGKTAQALAEMRRGRDIIAALVEASQSSPDATPDAAKWAADLARVDGRIATLTGRPLPRPGAPGTTPQAPTLASAPAAAILCESGTCPPVPPGATAPTAAAVQVASDLRSRIEALPAATSKLDN
jgi:tetratricopeptide (TPR) repeat protein